MSVTAALSTALTGLAAASRSAGVVSDNIANAMTEGFARREISLGGRLVGQGVDVLAVERVVDGALLQDRRSADAETAALRTTIDFFDTIARSVGRPDGETGITDLIADFEAALVSASARPDNLPSLSRAVDAAGRLVDRFGEATGRIQDERLRADAAIGSAVSDLQADLKRVAELNTDIRRATVSGSDANALLDARQTAIDRISDLVPVRELQRGHGTVALLSQGGLLLDGTSVRLEFASAPAMSPAATIANGALSQIIADGQPVDMERDKNLLSGGRLQALVNIRDVEGPSAQARLDALAYELVARSEAADTDVSGAGLFTDSGGPAVPGSAPGLAARIEMNAAVAGAGGQVWRLRDGLAAVSPGATGNATLLDAHRAAVSDASAPASAALGPQPRSIAQLAGDALASLTLSQGDAEDALVAASARQTALESGLAADGVDTDSEMQALLLIERAYAANARVVSTAGRMIDTLLEI